MTRREEQKGQARSLQFEADLDDNSLNGFGVISVTDMTVGLRRFRPHSLIAKIAEENLPLQNGMLT